MARNLDLGALRSFVAVAETGGVTRAAQRLHLTQSGVSMQLKRLEESLGAALLAREGRGVALTKTGEELLPQARKMLALNDEIWRRMTAPTPEGELTLGIPHDIIYPLAPLVLRRFAEDFPGVSVTLTSPPTRDLLQAFDAGEIDVILTTERAPRENGETLARRPLVWIGAPGGQAWRKRPIPLATDPRCAFRKPSFEALDAAGIPWEWVISASNQDAVSASIAADLAICALLQGTAPTGLEEIPHDGALPELPWISINLYVNGDPQHGLADRLAHYVRECFAAADPLKAQPIRRVA